MRTIVLLYIMFALNICCIASLVPAYKKKIRVNTDDGSVCIYLRGDENCKFAVSEDGYTLLQASDSWYFACKDEVGNVCMSEHKLLQKRSEETKKFLRNVEKGIQPLFRQTSKKKFINTTSRSESNARSSVIGVRRVLVVLMQFSDAKFVKEAHEFDALFNEQGYNSDGAMGSVYDYYSSVSYGKLTLLSDIYGPYTSNYPMSYYGGNSTISGADKNPKALFDEALEKLSKVADLSLYDSDNDGYIDNLHIIYAGYGEEAGAPAKAIWAHEMTFSPITVQGVKIDRYSCSPELRGNSGNGISRIGVSCHEIGHALGAMDYYDTDYTINGEFQGTGVWDVMAQGSWNNNGISPADFNPYVKAYNFGWLDVRMLPEGLSSIIYPSLDSSYVYRVNTAVENEFFLLENRTKDIINKYIPGEGLLIYHIDASIENKAQNNKINAAFPQTCYPVCASSLYATPNESPESYGKINSSGCVYPGSSNNSAYGKITTPAAICNNGEYSGVELGDIVRVNKNICLSYNKNGTNSNDTDVVWKEDFEDVILSSFWHTDGVGSWTVRKFLGGSATGENPNTISGKGYMVFACEDNSIISDRVKGCLYSDNIILPNNKECNLNFSFCKYSPSINVNDSLIVYICENEKPDNWVEISSNRIDRNRQWQSLSIKLDSLYSDIRIAICGSIRSGSMLFVDAMSITSENNMTDIGGGGMINPEHLSVDIEVSNRNRVLINNMLDKKANVWVYAINGNLLHSYVINSFSTQELVLKDGMYIVKTNNCTKKIRIGTPR